VGTCSLPPRIWVTRMRSVDVSADESQSDSPTSPSILIFSRACCSFATQIKFLTLPMGRQSYKITSIVLVLCSRRAGQLRSVRAGDHVHHVEKPG
jgi:hypothetical protein